MQPVWSMARQVSLELRALLVAHMLLAAVALVGGETFIRESLIKRRA